VQLTDPGQAIVVSIDRAVNVKHARRTSGALTAYLMCGVVSAHAAPGQVELTWKAPPGCPDRGEVEQRIVAILNRPVQVRDGEQLHVSAVVEEPQLRAPWRVELVIDNGRRRANRSLRAASCDELANATALVVAILLEPSVEKPPAGNAGAPTEAAPPTGTPSRAPEPTSAEPEGHSTPQQSGNRNAPVRVGVGTFVGAIDAMLPSWSGGVGVDAVVRWRALRAHISGAYFLPVERRAADDETQGARFRLISSQAEIGLSQPIFDELSVAFGAGAQLAFLRGEGFGPGVVPNTQNARFVAISAGGQLTFQTGPALALVVDADALFPLGSRNFVFSGSAPTSIYTPGWGVQLAVGVQFYF
jgi:hypothetical protein